ncbi:MAG TPA: exonuclease [Desulfobacteraceae bacterium]|nr:exonuclease [Desulfobacteraceae bacterium]
MGLLTSSISITRYKVNGELQTPIKESIYNGLRKNLIQDIDKQPIDRVIGWTSFESPYIPDFQEESLFFGSHIIFSLRIDKKTLPTKLIKKFVAIETAKLLKQSGREFLSTNEKKTIKDEVIDRLNQGIPATPNIYDVIWNYEEKTLWFLSNLKAANEELETLFLKSFDLTILRLFPYTGAYFMKTLSDSEKDLLTNVASTQFSE